MNGEWDLFRKPRMSHIQHESLQRRSCSVMLLLGDRRNGCSWSLKCFVILFKCKASRNCRHPYLSNSATRLRRENRQVHCMRWYTFLSRGSWFTSTARPLPHRELILTFNIEGKSCCKICSGVLSDAHRGWGVKYKRGGGRDGETGGVAGKILSK